MPQHPAKKPRKKKHLLKTTQLDFVGLVDKGANQAADIVFWKRAGVKPLERDGHSTFREIQNNDQAREEIWRATSNLSQALTNALEGDDIEDPSSHMRRSVAEFNAAFETALPQWAGLSKSKEDGVAEPGLMEKMMDAVRGVFEKAKGEEGKNTGGKARRMIQILMDAGMSQEQIGSGVDRSASVIGSILSGEIKNPPESLITSLRGVKAPKDGSTKKGAEHMFDTSELPDAAKEAFVVLTKRAEDAEATVEKLSEGDGGEGGNEEDLSPEVQKRLSDAETRAEAAEGRIAKLEGDKVRDQFIAKANGLKDLGMTGDDHAEILRKAYAGLDEEEATALDDVFKAAVEQVRAGALFAEIGGAGGGIVKSATETEVDGLVDELVKAEPTLKRAVARGRIYKAHPELLERAENERQAQLRAHNVTTED